MHLPDGALETHINPALRAHNVILQHLHLVALEDSKGLYSSYSLINWQ